MLQKLPLGPITHMDRGPQVSEVTRLAVGVKIARVRVRVLALLEIWAGGSPYQPGVPHLRENRPLD